MIRPLFLFCTLTIIICFSLVNVSIISNIYNQAGILIGLSPDWVKAQTFHISNVSHVLAYCLLYFCIRICYKLSWIVSVSLVFSIACSLEFLQFLTPKRQFSFEDIAYNLIGIVLGSTLLVAWHISRRQKNILIRDQPDDQ